MGWRGIAHPVGPPFISEDQMDPQYPPPLMPKPALVARVDPMYPSPKLIAPQNTTVNSTVRVAAKGMHVHKCPYCGHEWDHSDDSGGAFNDPVARAAHTCSECNRLLPGSWTPAQRGVKLETRESLRTVVPQSRPPVQYKPITQYQSIITGSADCPPGGT